MNIDLANDLLVTLTTVATAFGEAHGSAVTANGKKVCILDPSWLEGYRQAMLRMVERIKQDPMPLDYIQIHMAATFVCGSLLGMTARLGLQGKDADDMADLAASLARAAKLDHPIARRIVVEADMRIEARKAADADAQKDLEDKKP